MQDFKPNHVLLAIYKIRITKHYPELPEFTNKWACGHNVQLEQRSGRSRSHSHIVCRWQLNPKKLTISLFLFWYWCPTSLQRIYPDASDICWRCHYAKGSLLHIWWECPQILDFWDKIIQLYTTVTGRVNP